MKLWLNCIIVLLAPLSLNGQEELVFWKKNSRLYQRIVESRYIMVSSRTEKHADHDYMRIIGAGLVKAPHKFTIEKVQQFEDLKQVSSYFQEVKHNKKAKKIYFFIKAFGYEARFLMRYNWVSLSETEQKLEWLVVWGKLKGMQGHFLFEGVNSSQTLLSTWTKLDHSELPLPSFLMGFTLEVIAEKVAQKMRNFIERSWQDSEGKNVQSK